MSTKKVISLLAGLILITAGSFHLLRVILGWGIVIEGWTLPLWVSAILVPVALYVGVNELRRK